METIFVPGIKNIAWMMFPGTEKRQEALRKPFGNQMEEIKSLTL